MQDSPVGPLQLSSDESNDPSSAVTLWPTLSLFVQVTLSPTSTEIELGL
jgi:hypothetical protein